MITGHAEVNFHRYKMERVDSLECRFCELEDEVIIYILCDNEALVNERRPTLGMEFIEELYLKAESIRSSLQFWESGSDRT